MAGEDGEGAGGSERGAPLVPSPAGLSAGAPRGRRPVLSCPGPRRRPGRAPRRSRLLRALPKDGERGAAAGPGRPRCGLGLSPLPRSQRDPGPGGCGLLGPQGGDEAPCPWWERVWLQGKCCFRCLNQKSWRWKGVSANERALQYRVGERIHGFTVEQVSIALQVPLVGKRLSGARRLHTKYWHRCFGRSVKNDTVITFSYISTTKSFRGINTCSCRDLTLLE